MAVEKARQELVDQWRAFNVDLRDIHSNFDQFYWIRTLSAAFFSYVLSATRLMNLAKYAARNRGHVIQFIPLFAISLVCGVLAAYYFVLHEKIMISRWCDCEDSIMDGRQVACFWSNTILAGACYIVFMIVYYYLITVFKSPGVVNTMEPKSISNKGVDVDTNDKSTPVWKSYNGQGGCCYIHVTFNPSYDKKLVEMHESEHNGGTPGGSSVINKTLVPESGSVFIPSPCSSYCKKCKIVRPPRSHHCSKCNRCVLQVRNEWLSNGNNMYEDPDLNIITFTSFIYSNKDGSSLHLDE
jgi:hypothetical protein